MYCVINALYNYCISNKSLLEECDKKQNVAVTGTATVSCFKRILQNVLSNVTYSPSHPPHRPPYNKYPVNTSHRSDLWKNVSLQCYRIATVINILSLRSQICVCVCVYVCVYIYIYIYIQGVPGGM